MWFFELFEEKSTPFGVLDNIVFEEEENEEEEENMRRMRKNEEE